eukprot:443814_1
MGDFLPEIDLGTGFIATQIASSGHTCALSDVGSVKCWGYNSHGQLGTGNTDDLGDGNNEMGDDLSEIELGTDLIATGVTVSTYHTCAIFASNVTKCWGYWGRLGNGFGAGENVGDEKNEMGDDLLPIDLGTDWNPKYIISGDAHNCVVSSGYPNAAKCFGDSAMGDLGYGDMNKRGDGGNEMGDFLPEIDFGLNFDSMPTPPPSDNPTRVPTNMPSKYPSINPSSFPTDAPSKYPSISPSSPTDAPSKNPSANPSAAPTEIPSAQPSTNPSLFPTRAPSKYPSTNPSSSPTEVPSEDPSINPSSFPTDAPSSQPSISPSTASPTGNPSAHPSNNPSSSPTEVPSSQPSNDPSVFPTGAPSRYPTVPIIAPSGPPTQPSSAPSKYPSTNPSSSPTEVPSEDPSTNPSSFPTGNPSAHPSVNPSSFPTGVPSTRPSIAPSVDPSTSPSVLPSADAIISWTEISITIDSCTNECDIDEDTVSAINSIVIAYLDEGDTIIGTEIVDNKVSFLIAKTNANALNKDAITNDAEVKLKDLYGDDVNVDVVFSDEDEDEQSKKDEAADQLIVTAVVIGSVVFVIVVIVAIIYRFYFYEKGKLAHTEQELEPGQLEDVEVDDGTDDAAEIVVDDVLDDKVNDNEIEGLEKKTKGKAITTGGLITLGFTPRKPKGSAVKPGNDLGSDVGTERDVVVTDAGAEVVTDVGAGTTDGGGDV